MLRTKLSVNLNKVALLRNSREGNWPDLVFFGLIALEAGAARLTVHSGPDPRLVPPPVFPPMVAPGIAYPHRDIKI